MVFREKDGSLRSSRTHVLYPDIPAANIFQKFQKKVAIFQMANSTTDRIVLNRWKLLVCILYLWQ